MNILFRFLLFVICLISIDITAQNGTKFWFVAPDAIHNHGDEPLYFRITTFEKNATVTISMPANSGFKKIEKTIGKNKFATIEVPRKDVENRPVNKVNSKGLLIESTADITVYYEIADDGNPDKFTLKGEHGLGKEFFVPSQNVFKNMAKYNSDANEKVDIVATEDNTIVSIVPTVNVTGHKKNVPYDVKLNRGQTYCIEYRDISASASMAGTYITSNKSIAVTISDDSINESSHPHDIVGDQLIPTSVIGLEYIAVKTNTDRYGTQKVFVLATQDDTYVFINNNKSLVRHLKRGELTSFDITDNAIYIKATKPVYAYQVSGLANVTTNNHANELGSALLPTIECTGSSRVAFTRVFARTFWVQILTKRKYKDSFVMYDSKKKKVGFINDLKWKKVKGTDDGKPGDIWYSAIINMNVTTGTPYTIENSEGLFHLSVLDENDPRTSVGSVSYGYFSSYGRMHIEGPTQECVGEEIELQTSVEMKNYYWFSESEGNEVQSKERNYKVKESGKYWVTAEIKQGGCIITDSIDVVFNMPDIELGIDTSVCPGETVVYNLPGAYPKYEWSTNDSKNSITVDVGANYSEDISVKVTDDFGCTAIDNVLVNAYPIPKINLDHIKVCLGQRVTNVSSFKRYKWEYKGTLLNDDATTNFIVPMESGTYSLTVWSENGCVQTEDFDIEVHQLPTLTLNDQRLCDGSTKRIEAPAGAGYSYKWSTGSTDSYIELNAPTEYSLEVTDANGCVVTQDAKFEWYNANPIDLGEDKEECAGMNLDISTSSFYTDFKWMYKKNSGATNTVLTNQYPVNSYTIQDAKEEDSGIYIVEALDTNGCPVSDEVQIKFYDAAPPVLSLERDLCGGEEIEISASKGYDSYVWYKDGVDLLVNPHVTRMGISEPGNYVLEASYKACVKRDEIEVVQHDLPLVELADSYMFCQGTQGEIKVEDFVAAAGTSFKYLYWNSNEEVRYNDWSTASYKVNTAGEYSVTAVDEHGCSATDIVNVEEAPVTKINLGETQAVCDYESVLLTNPDINARSYSWYKLKSSGEDIILSNASLNVTEQGTYLLRVIDENGCEVSDKIDVNIKKSPELNIVGDAIACGQTTINVSAESNYERYKWNNNPGLNTNQLLVQKSGSYKLEVWNTDGCRAEDVLDVIVHPLPDFDFEDQVGCDKEPFTVAGPAGYASYNWSNGESAQSVVLNFATDYWLEVTDANGCVKRENANLSYRQPLSIDLGPDRDECIGVTLSINNSSEYSDFEWTFQPSSSPGTSLALNPVPENQYKIIDSNVSNSGLYSLKAKDINGCSVQDDVDIKFHTANPPSLRTSENLCEGEEIDIIATEGYDTYSWFKDGVHLPAYDNQFRIVGVQNPALYKVEASADACVKTSEIEIMQHGLPSIDMPAEYILCDGVEGELKVDDFTSNDGADFAYLFWNSNEKLRFDDWRNSSLKVNAPGNYSVTAVDEFGCEATDNVSVSVAPKINLLGNDTTVCKNEFLRYLIDDSFSSYVWSNGDIDNEIDFFADQGGLISFDVLVTDENGCENTDTIDINVSDFPIITLNKTEVCAGEAIENTTSFEKYEWTYKGTVLNTNESQHWIVPPASGIYTLTAWSENGCSISEDIYITVHALPILSLNDQKTCEGESLTINAPSGYVSYKWSTGEISQSIVLKTASNYSLEVTDFNGCSASDEATLSYHQTQSIDLGPDREECGDVILNIPNSAQYTDFKWFFQPSSNPGTTVNVKPIVKDEYWVDSSDSKNSGLYIIKAKDSNACPVSDDVTVILQTANPPTLYLTENLCEGEMIDVIATKGYDSYSWSVNGTKEILYDNLDQLPNVKDAGTYSVVATLGSCVRTSEIEVVKRALPKIKLPDVFEICKGSEGSLKVDDFISYSGADLDYLYWNKDDELRYKDWNSASLAINSHGQYSVTAVDAFGCVATDNIEVTEIIPDDFNLGDPFIICDGESLLLENPVADFNNYAWYKKESGSDHLLVNDDVFNVTKSGTYILRGVYGNGCEAEDDVEISVKSSPLVKIEGDKLACNQTVLRAVSTNNNLTYQWNDNPDLSTNQLLVNESGEQKLQVRNQYGCESEDVIDVTIDKVDIELQNETVCAGGLATLKGPSGSYKYLWSTGAATQSIPVSQGKYSLKVIDDKGCVGIDTAQVLWNPVPKVNLGSDTLICLVDHMEIDAGGGFASYLWQDGAVTQKNQAVMQDTINMVKVRNEYGCIGFDTKLVRPMSRPGVVICSDTSVCKADTFDIDAGDGFTNYLWNDGDVTRTKQIVHPGEYWVEVTDGCFVFKDTAVIVYQEPPLIAQIDTTVYARVAVLAKGGTAPYRYRLDHSDLKSKNVFENLSSGAHIIEVEDVNGCKAEVSVNLSELVELEVPPFFTPNGDGRNDKWRIHGIDAFPDAIIKIYDRYGKLLIKYLASDQCCWDGRYKGQAVPTDDYWYVVELVSSRKILKGHITLKR